jgi:hypothetical protein
LKLATSSLEPPSLGESTRITAFGKDSQSGFQRVMVADETRKVCETRLLNLLNVARSPDDPGYYYARLLGVELPQPVETGQWVFGHPRWLHDSGPRDRPGRPPGQDPLFPVRI